MAYIIFLVLEGKQKRSWEVSCVWSDAPVQAGTVRPSLLFKAIGKLHFPVNWFNLAKVEQDNSHDVNRHSCFVSGRVVFFFPIDSYEQHRRGKKKNHSHAIPHIPINYFIAFYECSLQFTIIFQFQPYLSTSHNWCFRGLFPVTGVVYCAY